VITYETRPSPALHFLVNFGVYAGREVTRLELHRLAEELLKRLASVTLFAEQRFELGHQTEVDLHLVRVEVDHEALPARGDVEDVRAELRATIVEWARGCMTSFSGAELTEAQRAASEAVVDLTAE